MDKKRASKWVWGVAVLALSVTLAAALALHVRDSNSATSGSFATSAPPAPDRAPDGMVWVPGGSFWMGDPRFPDAQPVHRVTVDPFWMDKTEVTNAQFARFVNATGYVTVAERVPDPKDFPDVPRDKLKAGSI